MMGKTINHNQAIFDRFWMDNIMDETFYDRWIKFCHGDMALFMEWDFYKTREEMDTYFLKIMKVIEN